MMIKNKIFQVIVLFTLITSILAFTSCSGPEEVVRDINETHPGEPTLTEEKMSQELIESDNLSEIVEIDAHLVDDNGELIIENETVEEIQEVEKIEEIIEEELNYTTKEISGCELSFEYSSDWEVTKDKSPSNGDIFFEAKYKGEDDLFIEVAQMDYNGIILDAIEQIENNFQQAEENDPNIYDVHFRTLSTVKVDANFTPTFTDITKAEYKQLIKDIEYDVKENVYYKNKICIFAISMKSENSSEHVDETLNMIASIQAIEK